MSNSHVSLEESIRKWLLSQGYPLEMMVTRAFREAGAGLVSQSSYYLDPETGKPREIDVVVRWHGIQGSGLESEIEYELFFIIECKSQQKKPWIVFSEQPGSVSSGAYPMARALATAEGESIIGRMEMYDRQKRSRMLALQDAKAYRITQALESGHDVPYEAVMSCLKAAVAEIGRAKKLDSDRHLPPYNYQPGLHLFAALAIPVVVTDALLFDCRLDENNSPCVTQISSACLEWKYPLDIGSRGDLSQVYIYTAASINQLVDDAKELQQKLALALPQHLERRIREASGMGRLGNRTA